MSLQTLGTAALSVLVLLAVEPLSKGASDDRLSLAVYFSELAAQERALADSYGRLAAIYKDKTPPPGIDDVTAREMAIHYRRVAEAAKKAAAAAASVAAYHSRVAEQVGDTLVPNSARHATQSFAAMGK